MTRQWFFPNCPAPITASLILDILDHFPPTGRQARRPAPLAALSGAGLLACLLGVFAGLVLARSQAPSGALESSPGRKPCGNGPETRQPRRGVRKRFAPGDRSLAANGSFAPTGLLAVRVCSHGSRHGLLSRAPPGLMPMKVTSKVWFFLAPLRG